MVHHGHDGTDGGIDGGAVPRALRWLLLGSGPLKRRSDRVEMVSRLVLTAVLLLAVPVSLAVGTVARGAAAETAAAQAASRTQVSAVLVEDTVDVTLGAAGDRQYTLARWTTPDGLTGQGRVSTPVGSTAGQQVGVWLDAEGRVTRAPMTAAETTDRAMVRGALTFLVLSALALGGHGAVCLLLARHRSRQWDTGWTAVEPLWADRRWPGADSVGP